MQYRAFTNVNTNTDKESIEGLIKMYSLNLRQCCGISSKIGGVLIINS